MIRTLALRVALAAAIAAPLAAAPVSFLTDSAEAATTKKKKKKRGYNRSDFTPEQRERIMENARKTCKKQFGNAARVYRLDYARNTIWCVPS